MTLVDASGGPIGSPNRCRLPTVMGHDLAMTAVSMTSVGLAGFGSAGRGIHAPLLQQAGMAIAAVATADPHRVKQVHQDLPGAAVVADLDALLGVTGLDLIVLATPSGLHAGQARQCIDTGIAVVVDKPLATDATQAFGVVDAARAAGCATDGLPEPAVRRRACGRSRDRTFRSAR